MQKSLLEEIEQIERLEQELKKGLDMSNPCNNHLLRSGAKMEMMRKALQQIINVTKGSKAYSDGAKAHYIAFSTLKNIQQEEGI